MAIFRQPALQSIDTSLQLAEMHGFAKLSEIDQLCIAESVEAVVLFPA
jgi:hypothetical protein